MNICFMVPSMGAGGAERTVSYLTKEFIKRGDLVSIITVFDDSFYEVDKEVLCKCIDIRGSSKLPRLMNRIICGILRYRKVNQAINEIKPDIVFCILTDMAKYVINAKRYYCLITSERTNPSILPKKVISQKKKIYRKSDGIVFQTNRAKAFFCNDIGDKGIVIQNAVSIETSKVNRTTANKKFTAVGRLIDAKDYPTMIRAFYLFHQSYPDYILEIFGDGPNESDLKTLVEELELAQSVFLKGTVKGAIYSAIDSTAFLFSSKYEGMPNVLLEALALGVPCISTRCPNGPEEIIQDGVNGFLTDVGNPESFCECMKYVVENPERRELVAKNGKKINGTNSISNISDQYHDYFVSVMKNQNRK